MFELPVALPPTPPRFLTRGSGQISKIKKKWKRNYTRRFEIYQ